MPDFDPRKMIRVAREAHGWSQRELADQAGVTKSRVHRLESEGVDRVQVETVYAVARTLSLTVEALLGKRARDRWQPRMAWQMMQQLSWATFADGLHRAALELRCYRPEVCGLGQLVASQTRAYHTLYTGQLGHGSADSAQLDPKDCYELLQSLYANEAQTEKLIGPAPTIYCPLATRPLWVIKRQSVHGATFVYCCTNPQTVGGVEQMSLRVKDVVDRVVDLLYLSAGVLAAETQADHERRIRAIEVQLKRERTTRAKCV